MKRNYFKHRIQISLLALAILSFFLVNSFAGEIPGDKVNTSEGNRSESGKLALPDFHIFNGHHVVDCSKIGGPGNYGFYIANDGGAYSVAYTIKCYLSTSYELGSTYWEIGSQLVSHAGGVAVIDVSMDYTLPCSITPGMYYIIIVLDPDNEVLEANENNNTYGWQTTVCDISLPAVTFTNEGILCLDKTVSVSISSTYNWVNYDLYKNGVNQNIIKNYSELPWIVSTIGTYTVGLNVCNKMATGSAVVVNSTVPAQSSAISGNANPCPGASLNYSVINVPGITYSWSAPGDWTITAGQGTNTITVTAGSDASYLSVTPSNSCGQNGPYTKLMVAGSKPDFYTKSAIANTYNLRHSQVATINCTIANQGCSYGNYYNIKFYLSENPTLTGYYTEIGTKNLNHYYGTGDIITSINYTPPCSVPTGDYYIIVYPDGDNQVTEGNENNNVYSFPVTISPYITTIPNVTMTNGGALCPGGTVRIGLSYTDTYISYNLYKDGVNQNLPRGNTNAYWDVSLPGTYTVLLGHANSTCTYWAAGNATLVSTSLPAEYGFHLPSLNDSPCQGSTETYSLRGGLGATSFIWTVPTGWQSDQGNATLVVTYVGSTSGNITVTPANICGNGTTQSVAVTPVTSVPSQPDIITGSDNYTNPCPGTIGLTYSITNVAGVIYTWAVPSDWTITAGQGTNSITVTTGSTSGNVSVTPSNDCGSGIAQTVAVTTNTIPNQPGTINGPTSVSVGQDNVTFTINAVANATEYHWTMLDGTSHLTETPSLTYTIPTNAVSGIISVKAVNSCGESSASTLTVTIITCIPPVLTADPAYILTDACTGNGIYKSIVEVFNYEDYVPLSTIWFTDGNGDGVYTTGDGSGDVYIDNYPIINQGTGTNVPGTYHLQATTLQGYTCTSSINVPIQYNYINGQTYRVNNTQNSGDGSLRAAIEWANNDNTYSSHSIFICSELSGQTFYLTEPLSDITSPMEISPDYNGIPNNITFDLTNLQTHANSDKAVGFTIKSSDVSIQGFTFSNANYENEKIAIGANYMSEKVPYNNLSITNNYENLGTSVYLDNISNAYLIENTFTTNNASGDQLGIYLSSCNNIDIGSNIFGLQSAYIKSCNDINFGFNSIGENSIGTIQNGLTIQSSRNIYIGTYFDEPTGTSNPNENFFFNTENAILLIGGEGIEEYTNSNIDISNNIFGSTTNGVGSTVAIQSMGLNPNWGSNVLISNNTIFDKNDISPIRVINATTLNNLEIIDNIVNKQDVAQTGYKIINYIGATGVNSGIQTPVITSWENYLFTGTISGASAGDILYIYKTDEKGSIINKLDYWTVTLDGTGNWTKSIESIEEGQYVIANYSHTDPSGVNFNSTSEFCQPFKVETNCLQIYGITCPEYIALHALYNSTNGAAWTSEATVPKDKPWFTGMVSTWKGISVANNHVTQINLGANNLTGQLPVEIANLTYMTSLYLTNNQIGGTIPPEISGCSELVNLRIDNNKLVGTIPLSIATMPKLTQLFLSTNLLSGPIPANLWEKTNLINLLLNGNNFGGTIPPEIVNLSNLTYLHLANCGLSGTIPNELWSLNKLNYLYLNSNTNLTGTLDQIGNLSNLLIVDLSNTKISGSIPSTIGNLTKAGRINFNNMLLTSPVPTELFGLAALNYLGLSNNSFSPWSLPPQVQYLTNMMYLYLGSTNLEGPLPAEIAGLTKLQYLALASNNITSIPAGFGTISTLNTLTITNNKLTFDDLQNITQTLSTFSYAPQRQIGQTTTVNLPVGESYSINLNIDNGISTNIYKWYKGTTLLTVVPNQNSLTVTATDLSVAGVYHCEVTSTLPKFSALKLVSYNYTVNVVCPELTGINSINQTCALQPVTFSAAGNNLSANLSYLWNFGDGTTSNLANPTHLYANAGEYLISLNITGCTALAVTKNISIGPAPTVTTIGSDTYCAGEDAQITFNFTASLPVIFTYANVTTGVQSQNTRSNANTYTILGSTEGIYKVTSISDLCTTTPFDPNDAGVTVSFTEPIQVFNFSNGTHSICEGSNDGPNFVLSGSVVGIDYQLLRNGVVIDEETKSGTNNAITWENITDPGTYTVLAKRQDSECYRIMNNTATLVIRPAVTVYLNELSSICEGQEGSLGGTLTGTAPWNVESELTLPNNTKLYGALEGIVSSSYTYPVAIEGDYQITSVTDAYGCQNTLPSNIVHLEVHPLPDAEFAIIDGTSSYCVGQTAKNLEPNTFGGTFTISPDYLGMLTTSGAISSLNFPNGSKNNYILTYTNSDQYCSASSSKSIIVNGPTISWPNWESNLCKEVNSTFTLTGRALPAGGQFSLNGENLSNFMLGDMLPQTYTFVYSASDAYCTTTAQNTITFHELPTMELISSAVNNEICSGSELALTVNMLTNPSNQQPVYEWLSPNTGNAPNLHLWPTESFNQSARITDIYGCSANDDISIVVNELPAIDVINVTAASCPTTKNGAIGFKMHNGESPYTYSIYPEKISLAGVGTETVGVNALWSGQHTLSVKDYNGCIGYAYTTIPSHGPAATLCIEPALCSYNYGDVASTQFVINATRPITNANNDYRFNIYDASNRKVFPTDQTGTFNSATPLIIESGARVGGSYKLQVYAEQDNCKAQPVASQFNSSDYTINLNKSNSVYSKCLASDVAEVILYISNNSYSQCTQGADQYNVHLEKVNTDGTQTIVPNTDYMLYEGTAQSVNLSEAGNYIIVAYPAGHTECTFNQAFWVENSQLSVEIAGYDAKCPGENGSAMAYVTGDEGSHTIVWTDTYNGGSNVLSTADYCTDIHPYHSAQVTVTADGCSQTFNKGEGTFLVDEPPTIQILPMVNDHNNAGIFYDPENLPCTLGAQITGGTPPYLYTWYQEYEIKMFQIFGSPILQTVKKPVATKKSTGTSYVNDLLEGTYSLAVTDKNGCKASFARDTDKEIIATPEIVTYNLLVRYKTVAAEVYEEPETEPPATLNQIKLTNSKYKLLEQTYECIDKQVAMIQKNIDFACDDIENLTDEITVKYKQPENMYDNYTLYYYDRAGRLLQTVPPEGVVPNDNRGRTVSAEHTMETTYGYDNRSLVKTQTSPDGGTTNFAYNRVGQIRFSQNSEQANVAGYNHDSRPERFSYTKYDALGRIVEVGEAAYGTYSQGSNNFTITSWENLDNPLLLAVDEETYASLPVDDRMPNSSFTKYDVTRSYYSGPSMVNYPDAEHPQRNLLNRISRTETTNSNGEVVTTYYSYDVHGNVEWLVQDIPGIGQSTIAYTYDLISGKVIQVVMNKGRTDAFYHKYEYDEDNRIEAAFTSTNGIIWDRDAFYNYYKHGPLESIELGQDKIQHIDYTYTLQGWLKAINTPLLTDDYNNEDFAGDKFGMVLGYYNGDFRSGTPWTTNSLGAAAGRDLYNGNISWWTTNTNGPSGMLYNNILTGYQYRYDKLNRIKGADFSTFSDGWQVTDRYDEPSYIYDGNGNIMNMQRNGDKTASISMDNLTYNYQPETNKLTSVSDAIEAGVYTDVDIDNQAAGNYQYDAIGNLVKDAQEDISIVWNAYGKVAEVIPGEAAVPADQKAYISYTYGADGNRVKKFVNKTPAYTGSVLDKNTINNPENVEITYYLRDASGNIMAVYEQNHSHNGDGTYKALLTQAEVPLYGSDRLGIYKPALTSSLAQQNFEISAGIPTFDLGSLTTTTLTTFYATRQVGQKYYELKDHLGNVRAVVTDRKLAGNDVEVKSASNYYPFGMFHPENCAFSEDYRFGFNGKEMDNDLGHGTGNMYDYGFRIYNPRIGKFLSVDPLKGEYPWYSPYHFAGNSPIVAIDIDGLEPIVASEHYWDYRPKTMPADASEVFYTNGASAQLLFCPTVKSPNKSQYIWISIRYTSHGLEYYWFNGGMKPTSLGGDAIGESIGDWQEYEPVTQEMLDHRYQDAVYGFVNGYQKGVFYGAFALSGVGFLEAGGGALIVNGGRVALNSPLGKQMSRAFAQDVTAQFFSNYLTNGQNVQDALNKIDFYDAVMKAVSKPMGKYSPIATKVLFEFIKTQVDFKGNGFNVKSFYNKDGSINQKFVNEYFSRLLISSPSFSKGGDVGGEVINKMMRRMLNDGLDYSTGAKKP